MSVLTYAAKMTKFYKKFTPRQYLTLAVLVVALAAMLALGFMIGRNSAAAALRDCGDEVNGVRNSIANNPNSGGGCGALSPAELVDQDIPNGDPDDQAGVFAHFGLTPDKYERFKNEAKMGIAKFNGDIVVEDQVVARNAWSIGRVGFDYSSEFPIEGVGTYFKSAHTDVLQSEIPIMVLFDEHGTMEAAVLTSCGNPVKAEKVVSSAECKKLHKTPVEDKKNTFAFTTEVELKGLAELVKVEYFANGEKFAEEEDPSTPVTKTFTEDSTIVAKVTVAFPGDKTKVIESELCKQMVEVKKKEAPPAEKPKEQPKVKAAKVEQPKLPVTGPADAAGLFFGTSLAGVIGHHLYRAYHNRRAKK